MVEKTVTESGTVVLPGGTPIKLAVSFEVPLPQLDGLPVAAVAQMMREYARRSAAVVLENVLAAVEERKALIATMPPEPPSVPWVAMKPAKHDMESLRRVCELYGVPIERALREEIWMNPWYTAHVRALPDGDGRPPGMSHLSIKRFDKAAVRDWRDFQRIKNDVLGPEWEAAELYPAESRLVDAANQYHLWCAPPGRIFPFGFRERVVCEHDTDPESNSRQRNWAPGETPADTIPPAEAGSIGTYV